MDPVTPTTLYVSSSDGLFKSTDGGATWILLTEFDSYNMVIDFYNKVIDYYNMLDDYNIDLNFHNIDLKELDLLLLDHVV